MVQIDASYHNMFETLSSLFLFALSGEVQGVGVIDPVITRICQCLSTSTGAKETSSGLVLTSERLLQFQLRVLPERRILSALNQNKQSS